MSLNRTKQKGKGKELSKGLSAVLLIENDLWVANDETITLERLSRQKDGSDGDHIFSEHEQFPLSNYLSLPVPASNDSEEIAEVDIEGLDYRDGYLWLVGSHSLKRSKPDYEKSIEKNFERLARVSSDGNRYLLAGIPLMKKDGTYTLPKQTEQNGIKRIAAQLPGTDTSNDLTNALAQDKHLQQFLAIPGKGNEFDIEGLAVGDNGHIFIGLRGPVLRSWAVILEVQLKINNENSSELKMQSLNSNKLSNPTYRKHFLDLGGLGIRDLCVDGSDLLVLAGPTMNLDGPVTIFRWKNGMQQDSESLVWSDGPGLERLMEVPYGQGVDHAEGMTVFSRDGGKIRSILVVYDSASEDRQNKPLTVIADIRCLSMV